MNIIRKCVLLSFCIFSALQAEDVVPQGHSTRDLVVRYFHNSEYQRQWALKALSHFRFKGDESILDFGSGDGKISASLSCMAPHGNVLGVDISDEMVFFASKMFPATDYQNLSFLSLADRDFTEISFGKQFDLITAFCVLHHLPNPKEVLQTMKRHMHRNSRLIASSPTEGNPEFTRAASEELQKWNLSVPARTEANAAMRLPETAREIIEEAGFEIEHFAVIEGHFPFSSEEEFVDWCEATLGASWHIPVNVRKEFFTNIVKRYLEYRPSDRDADGFVYSSFKKIEIVARPIFPSVVR